MYKKLSKIKSNDGVVFASIPANPGVHCPMHTSLASVRRLEGVSSLVVGMPECSFYSRYVLNEKSETSIHYTYVLDSNEVVFGSAKGLKEALIEMVKDGATNVVIIKTCIPSLIAEDIEVLAHEVSEEYGAKFAVLDLAHYKTNGYTTGYLLTSLALLEFISVDKNQRVNLLGDVGGKEYDDLKEQISKQYECFSYGHRLNYEKFLDLGKASYNIVFSASFLDLAIEMKKRFGIPFVYFSAYSSSHVQLKYQEVEHMLNMTLHQFETKECTEPTINQKFLSLITHVDGIEIVGILDEIRIEVVFSHIEEFSSAVSSAKERITHSDPRIAYVSNPQEFIKRTDMKYDICIQDNKEILDALSSIGNDRINKVYTYINKLGGE